MRCVAAAMKKTCDIRILDAGDVVSLRDMPENKSGEPVVLIVADFIKK